MEEEQEKKLSRDMDFCHSGEINRTNTEDNY